MTAIQDAIAQEVFGITGKTAWEWPEDARKALTLMGNLPNIRENRLPATGRILKILGVPPVDVHASP